MIRFSDLLSKRFNSIKYYIDNKLNNQIKKCQADYFCFKHRYKDKVNFTDKKELAIITVAFNNEIVIEQQIYLIKKFVIDRHVHIIADNSSDIRKRGLIAQICKINNVEYISVPENIFSYNSSYSHGLAMTWVYRNIVSKRNYAYFGFIDHDIYPIKITSVLEHMNGSQIYGSRRIVDNRWYLHPAFCFFKLSFLKPKKLYFLPIPGLDTAGSLWESTYKNLTVDQAFFADYKLCSLREGNINESDKYEMIDDWIHTINASHNFQIENPEEKEQLLKELFKPYL